MTENPKEVIYDSALRPPRTLDELLQAYNYRHLIWQLVRRDILTRYKRSILGIAWTMINPLGTMLVLSIAFSQVFKSTHGYSAYVLSGIMAWTFFSQTTTAAMISLVWGGGLMQRIYLPRTVFAISSIGTGIANLTLALVPLFLVMLVSGVQITWTVLFLPVPVLLLSMFSLGVGLIISAFAVYYPDVSEMYQIILTAWMYLSPVIYPEEILPEAAHFWITKLNPMYWLIKLFRMPLYEGRIPGLEELLPAVGMCVVILVAGWWFFCKRSDEFSYRI